MVIIFNDPTTHRMTDRNTLAHLRVGEKATIRALRAPGTHPEWERQLHDLGFVPGETVSVLRRAWFGGHRMVIRVGAGGTIALRRAEAACIAI